MDISNTKDLNNKFIFWRHDDKPSLLMLVGLPGSGKSTIADKIYAEDEDGKIRKPIVHSTDDVRLELFGDMNCQDNKDLVYKTIVKRIKDDLKDGKNVIYDATNTSKKIRNAFLNELKKIPVYKQCICVMTPYDVCLSFAKERDGIDVPEEKIKKIYMNWMPPSVSEGFDAIIPVYNYGNGEKRAEYTLEALFAKMDPFEQENKHHDYTLGKHCREAAKYIMDTYPNDKDVIIAALLHDNGKLFTKTTLNAKGVDDGDCHYYQHHSVGAYDSMFYTEMMHMNYEDRLSIANMIYYHMYPFTNWKQSEKAMKRDVRMMSDDMYKNIMKLHEADRAAHGNKKQEIQKEEELGDFEIER